MRRRDFVTLLGGWRRNRSRRVRNRWSTVRRVGMFMDLAENDQEGQTPVAAFRDGMKALGWIEGRNVNYDYRWTAGNPPAPPPPDRCRHSGLAHASGRVPAPSSTS
jgi:putative ABC transport system substrate-binding protein